jgi:phosphopentomutase
MEKKIIQKAKSEGADAVMIILFEEVKIGEERDDQFMNVSHEDAGWGLNVDTEGNTKQINSFNTRIDKGDRLETSVYKSVIKAIFLKKIPSSQKMTE